MVRISHRVRESELNEGLRLAAASLLRFSARGFRTLHRSPLCTVPSALPDAWDRRPNTGSEVAPAFPAFLADCAPRCPPRQGGAREAPVETRLCQGGRRQTQHEESLREAHLIGWRDTGFRYPGRTRPHDLGKDRLSALRPWHVNSLGESAIFHAQPSRHTLAGRDLDLDSEFCVLPWHDGHSVTVP